MIDAFEIYISIILFIYVNLIVFLTKLLFKKYEKREKQNVLIYYNRKIIHILAGGVTALLVPFLYDTPFIPSIIGFLMALLTWLPRRFRKPMRWFQTEENSNEVKFCIMWSLSMLIVWYFTRNLMLSVIPALMISFGDGITGVVRNALFKRRTKHWIGNLAMLIVAIPIGYLYGNFIGVIAAIIASIVERYEFDGIDDNVIIPLASIFAILIVYFLA